MTMHTSGTSRTSETLFLIQVIPGRVLAPSTNTELTVCCSQLVPEDIDYLSPKTTDLTDLAYYCGHLATGENGDLLDGVARLKSQNLTFEVLGSGCYRVYCYQTSGIYVSAL